MTRRIDAFDCIAISALILLILLGVTTMSGCGTLSGRPDAGNTLAQTAASGNVDKALDVIERDLASSIKPNPAAKTPPAPKAIAAPVPTLDPAPAPSHAQAESGKDINVPPISATESASEAENKPVKAIEERAPDSASPAWENFDLEKWLTNPWLIAVAFLLIQWLEIHYYSRTGKTSPTLDAAETALNGKLGVIHKILYRIWRKIYFIKHPEKKNPDEQGESK